jgi:hypothetical protein
MLISRRGHQPYIIRFSNTLIWYVYGIKRSMGKWKCLWCSKLLEGESFMDLVEASMKEEGGQHVHGWENITLVEEEAAVSKSRLLSV